MRKVTKQQMLKVFSDASNVENLVTDLRKEEKSIAEIIKSCWNYSIDERPSISSVVQSLQALRE